MAYTDLTEMTALVKQLTGLTPGDPLIQRKLSDSSGTSPDEVATYRPYFVSAKLLQQSRSDQALSGAKGVTFTNLVTMIKSLMDEQLSLDRALDLTVPPGFAAVLNAEAIVMTILSN